eukprot:TRINITY_DN1090_c0_g2_i1.p1 TRINITY_DN1090_c0_g2~~TRINITY_DN1090_c0_g2_i1.p1  ORF type:complete len:322 (+),score=90.84 TRINITY_DN1090_c0_g2_i1:73-1038(+)
MATLTDAAAAGAAEVYAVAAADAASAGGCDVELPFSGDDMVLGVLASHSQSRRHGCGGLNAAALARLAIRKAGPDMPAFVADRVGEWLPIVLQRLMKRGVVVNSNEGLNMRPLYSLSDAGKKRAESGTLPAGASVLAARPASQTLRGAGSKAAKRKAGRSACVSAATLLAAKKHVAEAPQRVEAKTQSMESVPCVTRRQAAAKAFRDRSRAAMLRELRGQDAAAAERPASGCVPESGGVVLYAPKKAAEGAPPRRRPITVPKRRPRVSQPKKKKRKGGAAAAAAPSPAKRKSSSRVASGGVQKKGRGGVKVALAKLKRKYS